MAFFETETGRIIAMIVVILLAVLLSSFVKKLMISLYINISGKQRVEPGAFHLIMVAMRLAIIIVGVSYAISFDPSIESLSKSFLTSAGIATAIIGFAAKDMLGNFVSGMVIVIFRPFTLTHWINVNNVHEGWVEEINMLYTVIRDKRNLRMIIPNSKIVDNYVINSSYGDEYVCQYVEFQVSYNSDIKKAKEIIREIAEADPFCIDNRTAIQKKENSPIVEIRLQALGEYAVVLRALVWVGKPANAKRMLWSLNEKVKEQFDKEGVEIPFPYRNLIMKNESP